jgi:hypothetical protein
VVGSVKNSAKSHYGDGDFSEEINLTEQQYFSEKRIRQTSALFAESFKRNQDQETGDRVENGSKKMVRNDHRHGWPECVDNVNRII